MNPAVAFAATGACERPRPAAGRMPADSGLRLLVGGALQRQLRWSLDPDAPDARALQPGEVRLAIAWVELSLLDLLQATGAASRRAGRDATGWQGVAAAGCGPVIETRVPGCRRGQWLYGPLHVGTHRVLRVRSVDGDAGLAASAEGDHASTHLRYTWIPPSPAVPGAIGPDAVEQAVLALRDCGCADPQHLRLSLRATPGVGAEGRRSGRHGGLLQNGGDLPRRTGPRLSGR